MQMVADFFVCGRFCFLAGSNNVGINCSVFLKAFFDNFAFFIVLEIHL
jgi:hypothetical protein